MKNYFTKYQIIFLKIKTEIKNTVAKNRYAVSLSCPKIKIIKYNPRYKYDKTSSSFKNLLTI